MHHLADAGQQPADFSKVTQLIHDPEHTVSGCFFGALCVLCGFFFLEILVAAAPPVVSLDGVAVEGDLISIDATGTLAFRTNAQFTLPFDQFVRWGHPAAPPPQIFVVLSDGSRVVTAAAWAGGAPVRLEGDSIVALTDLWGEVPLPRRSVRGIVFVQRSHPREREQLAEAILATDKLPEHEGRGDSVWLNNNDRVAGRVKALSGGSLELVTQSGAVTLPLSRVRAVVLGNSRQPSAVSRQSNVVVGTVEGSLLYAESIVASDKELAIALSDGLKLRGGSVNDLVLVQSLGGRFVYLSDLEPSDFRHVPYLTIEWPYHRDRNVIGEPLRVAGKQYLKGIGMHSAGRLTYRLDGQYRRFDAMMAIDDSAGNKGSVTCGVYVLRDGQWSAAYTSGVVRGGDSPHPIAVDVRGAQGITLTVDFADRGDEFDRADWLEARLVKN